MPYNVASDITLAYVHIIHTVCVPLEKKFGMLQGLIYAQLVWAILHF